MSSSGTGATAGWKTVGLLLRFARRRARARSQHQRRLRGQRGGSSTDWSAGTLSQLLIVAMLQGCVVALLPAVLAASQRAKLEAEGRIVVSERCLAAMEKVERKAQATGAQVDLGANGRLYTAVRTACTDEEQSAGFEERLLRHYDHHGRAGLLMQRSSWGLARDPGLLDGPAALLGSLVMLAWFTILALQGEGFAVDLQRRRHPMWEWLLGHPVDARAVFLAEMLSPLAANPSFWVAPVFWVGAFWIAYDSLALGLLAGLAAGLPMCAAAGCVGKAMEIVALLRLPPRNRGAVLGMLSWLGLAVMMLTAFAALTPAAPLALARQLVRAGGDSSLPLLGWALGLHGTTSAWKGVVTCWAAAAALIAAAAQISAQATRQGLAGGFGGAPGAPALLAASRPSRFLRDPAYRKELLWLWRDRGSLIQVLLVPITIAAAQLFNFRGLVGGVTQGWHLMAGATVVFGSYFLLFLGPRSLLSEGAALWIALTWPRGLEGLLKAKARLWWLISLVLVGALLLVTMLRFPADAWKVALVALLWAAFGRSLAEKGVTLVSAPSSSGEPEPVPRGRLWAASLGTFTLGAGILSGQWHLAIVGVVYSWLTAAAMWQNFRARLPYLFDHWSERMPPAPTLMHAMVAIAAMTEAMAVLFAFFLAVLGQERIALATSVAYGISGIGTWLITSDWLSNRAVGAREIWRWGGTSTDEEATPQSAPFTLAVGLGLGVVLGAAAVGYSALIRQLPEWGQGFRAASEDLAAHPEQRAWMAVMAVGLAPLAEEYLFRGLLFRALDREWGGARAILGSACFFAVYHPPQAWLPVMLLGALSALLFKAGGRLAPCVLLHMAYNAVVVWAS